MDRPQGVTEAQFEFAIRLCWFATPWGQGEIDIQPHADMGWLQYMLKPNTKPGIYSDAVLWNNCFLRKAVPVRHPIQKRLNEWRGRLDPLGSLQEH
jgi:hypothetical protein